jgi:hypothetical protein
MVVAVGDVKLAAERVDALLRALDRHADGEPEHSIA